MNTQQLTNFLYQFHFDFFKVRISTLAQKKSPRSLPTSFLTILKTSWWAVRKAIYTASVPIFIIKNKSRSLQITFRKLARTDSHLYFSAVTGLISVPFFIPVIFRTLYNHNIFEFLFVVALKTKSPYSLQKVGQKKNTILIWHR